MVYYVDKIQELENEVARIRSLRSSDRLKDKVEDVSEEVDNDDDEEVPVKGKCMGELVSAVVSREKEDLDEIILTKTRLDKGIQVSVEVVASPAPAPRTVSKGIQVGGEVGPPSPASPGSSGV